MSDITAHAVFDLLKVRICSVKGNQGAHTVRTVQGCVNEAVLLEASRLFWYFSRSDANKPVMVGAGHLKAVCDAIASHAHLPGVLFHLVVGLSNVALSLEASNELAKLQLFDTVAAAAAKNAEHLDTQLATCVLIGHMVFRTPDQATEANADQTRE